MADTHATSFTYEPYDSRVTAQYLCRGSCGKSLNWCTGVIDVLDRVADLYALVPGVNFLLWIWFFTHDLSS